ncbi:MAG TPA: hypothetical protein PKJ68_04470 [Candidatus Woesebacteria bacterium]|nr:hypothetical protein [Candidatus Woesebacteria bacterium]
MNILSQNIPIVKYSVRELQTMHTMLHYELVGINEQLKDSDGEDFVELAVARNKAKMLFSFVSGLLTNYNQLHNTL